MRSPHVLAMILAGGKGSRMDVLTRERPKPVLPFAGTHRLIDFPLSNLRHSRIDDVLMCVQYHATMLEQAVGGGRPWDLDRTRGGLLVVGPEEGRGSERSGFSTGNADLLRRYRHVVRAMNPKVLLVLSADHVYSADYTELIATHLESDADVTVLSYDLSKTEAVNHAVVEVEDGEYLLSDAGSTNGTFANGTKVDRYKLQEGDKIQIGASSVLKFTYHDDLDEEVVRARDELVDDVPDAAGHACSAQLGEQSHRGPPLSRRPGTGGGPPRR